MFLTSLQQHCTNETLSTKYLISFLPPPPPHFPSLHQTSPHYVLPVCCCYKLSHIPMFSFHFLQFADTIQDNDLCLPHINWICFLTNRIFSTIPTPYLNNFTVFLLYILKCNSAEILTQTQL